MSPPISIVIPVRNGLPQLGECLDSLAGQLDAPGFAVTVVDDGSVDAIPQELGAGRPFALEVVRQVPLGISAARNRGIRHATGEIIVFVDSDVVLKPDFLAELASCAKEYPEDVAFQARLSGGWANIVERMEGLRISATLTVIAQEDGHIKYANTSAFAIRRSLVDAQVDFFDPAAVRGEDTQMLAGLLRRGMVPRYAERAEAIHLPRIPLRRYLLKHFEIGYRTAPAREVLMALPSDVLLMGSGRRGVLRHMVDSTRENRGDRWILPLVAGAHLLERTGRAAYRVLGLRSERMKVLTAPVDCVREPELVARILAAGTRRTGMRITYLTAWTLVQAKMDPEMAKSLDEFDICYSDGMGVVLCSLLLTGRRLHKVTANNFMEKLCDQIEAEGMPVAFVGTNRESMDAAVSKTRERFPNLNLVGYSHGYLASSGEEELREKIEAWAPSLVIIGMGQPLQEQWVARTREALPHTVFLCVGGLFDYISGTKPTPPVLIRAIGLEWLYILITRPGRYWKRYIYGIPKLGFLVIREFASRIPWNRQPPEPPKP